MKTYGEWSYSSTILDLGTRWRSVVSFKPLPLYPRYPLDRRLRPDAVEKTLLCMPKIEPRPSSPQPVAIPTELSRLLHYKPSSWKALVSTAFQRAYASVVFDLLALFPLLRFSNTGTNNMHVLHHTTLRHWGLRLHEPQNERPWTCVAELKCRWEICCVPREHMCSNFKITSV
jgi:hypothetical protein